MSEIEKVFVYVVAGRGQQSRLLLFASHDEAGFEVPKGAVEPEESLEAAARREVLEEAGITELELILRLGTTCWERERQHFLIARCPGTDSDPFTHTVTGDGVDAGFVYQFRWRPLSAVEPSDLVQGCGRFLAELRTYLKKSDPS
jgi:8-oxo-dGTP pyrophosphatase MutT (NUDIX family)